MEYMWNGVYVTVENYNKSLSLSHQIKEVKLKKKLKIQTILDNL